MGSVAIDMDPHRKKKTPRAPTPATMHLQKPKKACRVPGCRREVGFSSHVGRKCTVCSDHLKLHQQQNLVSNLKRKERQSQLREKADAYDALVETNRQLQAEVRFLRQALSRYGPLPTMPTAQK